MLAANLSILNIIKLLFSHTCISTLINIPLVTLVNNLNNVIITNKHSANAIVEVSSVLLFIHIKDNGLLIITKMIATMHESEMRNISTVRKKDAAIFQSPPPE
ncbi:MAG TPA: hypothetical protein DEF87_11135 [Enterobacter asburiae]|nr:hypothetical protein [Enterobacter asburiae]HBW94654.1 hypothetical protein [Enterobacter asburiae]